MESMPPNRLSSSWVVRATAGEPVAVVRVRNLQTTVRAARDAWNRANKRQPLLVSAELSFAQSFSSASENDTLGSDTVHYGNLSKAILAAVAVADTDDRELKWLEESLGGVLETIWASLTGSTINGSPSNAAQRGERAFLDTTKLRFMSVTASLPKATLLGDGVSLTASSVFNTGRPTSPVHLYGICMCLHRLRVPTLIGVNSNERHSKQAVFADIKIDKVDLPPDFYPAVEGVVVKVLYPVCILMQNCC